MKSILEELGLTKNEIKIYLALLELGTTPAGILIKKVDMHRASVYDVIDQLINKGLISYKTAIMYAKDPSEFSKP